MGSSSDEATGRRLNVRSKFRGGTEEDDWVYGIWDCFEDPKVCLCSIFCLPCQVRSTASAMGEHGCLHWLMHCFVPCISLTMLRHKARERYHIDGDTCEDAVLSWFCMHCTHVQVANEVKFREEEGR